MHAGLVRILLPAGIAAALCASLACSSGNKGNSAAPAVNVVTTAVPRANIGSPGAGATTLTEITTDNKFSQTTFTVPAGVPITLTVQNTGQAIHNWNVTDTKDAAGKEIKTDLANPGKSASITFTIAKPGTYHFRCDVHPSDMTGTLTVQ